MIKLYFLLLISSITASLGQVFFKLAKGNFFSFHLLLGLFMYTLSTALWVYSLKYLPLSKVYPFTFLTFAFVLVLSHFLFGERISLINIAGALLIIIGIFLSVR